MASTSVSEEPEEYVDALGVITALERTCELEARLRQAIQDTHPLTTTLDWDFNAADKEREGLLAISEQLEYLEDKLREYRFLEPSEVDHQAVLLSQLDAVRRELVDVVDQSLPHITFGKEVVREVLAFAQVSDDGDSAGAGGMAGADGEEDEEELQGADQLPPGTAAHGALLRHRSSGSGSMGGFASEIEADPEAQPVAPSSGGAVSRHVQRTAGMYGTDDAEAGGEPTVPGGGGIGLIPAIRRGSSSNGGSGLLSRPPRYPSKEPAAMIPGPKATLWTGSAGAAAGGGGGGGGPMSPSSLHQRNQQQLALMQQQTSPPGRSAFLQQQQRDTAAAAAAAPGQRGYTTASGTHPLGANTVPGASSPGAAATASALRSAAASAAGLSGRSGRRQLDVDAVARGLVSVSRGTAGVSAGSSLPPAGDSYSFAPQQAAPTRSSTLPPPRSAEAQAAAPVQPKVDRISQQQAAPTAGGAQLPAAPGVSQGAGVQTYPVAPSSYAPSSYAPSDGVPSSRQSPYSSRTASGAPPAPPAAAALAQRLGHRLGGSKLLSRLNRAQPYGDSASSSRYEAYSRISDEDIYGALEGSKSRPASIVNPPPGQYGGFVRIRDRLSRAEEEDASKVPGPHTERRSPMPPRIYGDVEHRRDSLDSWETTSEIQPAGYAASLTLDPPTRERPSDRGPPRITHSAPVPRSPPRDRLHLAYSSGGAGVAGRSGRPDHSTARGGMGADAGASISRSGRMNDGSSSSGGSGLLGRLTNMLLTGAAAAAVAVVAQHAGPAVVQKGQEVARSLQGTQAAVASKWQAHQRRREQQQREKERQREQQRQRQKSSRLADKPASPSTFRAMADLPPSPPREDSKQQPRIPSSAGAPAPRRMADLPSWDRNQQAAAAAAAAAAVAAAQQRARNSSGGGPAPPSPLGGGRAAVAALGGGKPAAGTSSRSGGGGGGFLDPLPPHLAGAGRGMPAPGSVAGSNGGTPQRARPTPRGPQGAAGQLFPAMPPPDVSASMG